MRLHVALALLVISPAAPAAAHAAYDLTRHVAPQTAQQPAAQNDRQRINELLRQGKLTEALPLLERAAAASPSDGETIFYLGFVRSAAAKSIADGGERRRARVKARTEMLRAKDLGYDSELLEAGLASIPPDGGDPVRFSENPQVEAAMNEGEVAFSRGDFDAARKAYARALELDPKQYNAALFIGDSYFKEGNAKKGDDRTRIFAQAGEAFARAIAIDPNRETAHRYWGSALMEGGKMDEALDKVIEAYVTEPYNRMSAGGLSRWAQMNGLRDMSHPRVEVPVTVRATSANKIELGLAPTLSADDGLTAVWTAYGLERTAWMKEKFSKEFSGEKTYRHSLKEEAAALRFVVRIAQDLVKSGKMKQVDPSIANLTKLDSDGLLEAFILLARPDQGVAQDYAEYRKANADKLRRYVREYIMRRGTRV